MTSMRARRLLLALGLGGALAGTALAPRAARAQCTPAVPMTGDTVTCTGDITTGFDAGGVDQLTVNVTGAPGAATFLQKTPLADNEASVVLHDMSALNATGGTLIQANVGMTPIDATKAIQAGDGNTIDIGDGSTANTVSANGANARAMLLGDGNSVTVRFVSAVSASRSTGVAIEAGSMNTITNFGEIRNDSILAGGTAIRLTGGGNTIDNSNSILATTDSTAIELQTPGGTTNTVMNRSSSSRIEAPGAMGIAIQGGDGVEAVTNLGRILGRIDLGMGDDTVTNDGRGPGAGGLANGIIGDLDLGMGNDTLTNNGLIVGNVNLGDGDDTFTQAAVGSVGVVDAGAGTDQVVFTGPGSRQKSLSDFLGFESAMVTGGDWFFSGTGTFPSLTVTGGFFAPVDTVTLTGNYTQQTGSGFSARLTGQNQNDRLDVMGTATIQPGVPLRLFATARFDESSVFTILTATGGVTGAFDFPDTNVTAVLRGHQDVQANLIRILITRLPYAAPASTPNQLATGAALDAVRAAGPTGDMATVLQQFDLLQTGPFRLALDDIHPEAYDAETNRMIWRGRGFADAALARRPDCRPVPWPEDPRVVAPSPCGASGWTPWVASWGEFSERNGGAGHIDSDNLGGDLAAGADLRLGESWLLTGYVGTGGSDIDVTGHSNATLYSAEVGAAIGFQRGPLGVHAAAGYGHGWHHTRRDIAVGSIVRSAYSTHESNRVTGTAEAGWTFDFAPFFVEPLATVDWTWIQQDGLVESGAASLDLALHSRSDSVLSTTAGLRVGTTFYKHAFWVDWLEWADGVWRPEVSLRWREIWTGRDRDLTARFTGAPAQAGTFTVRGHDAERGAEAGLRVTFQPDNTDVQVGLDYDGFYGDGTFNHFVGVQVRIPIP